MTYARNDRVVVSQFVRRGDDADVSELDGWVVFYGEAVVIIANTPDWQSLPEDDYWTATFPLDDVIVSAYAAPVAAEGGAADVLFVLLVTGAAMFVIGGINILGGHWQWWPLALAGAALAYAVLVIALFMGAKGENDHE